MKIGDIQIDFLIDADPAVAAESAYTDVYAKGLTPPTTISTHAPAS